MSETASYNPREFSHPNGYSDTLGNRNLALAANSAVQDVLRGMGSSVSSDFVSGPLSGAMSWAMAPVVDQVGAMNQTKLLEMKPELKDDVSRLASSLTSIFGTAVLNFGTSPIRDAENDSKALVFLVRNLTEARWRLSQGQIPRGDISTFMIQSVFDNSIKFFVDQDERNQGPEARKQIEAAIRELKRAEEPRVGLS